METSLKAAKLLAEAKRYTDSVDMLKEIISGAGIEAPAAAYSLGVLFNIEGTGIQNEQLSERYYLVAESEGVEMASYQLAGYYHEKGRLDESIARYRLLASKLPSSSYWAYRILSDNPNLKISENELKFYLDLSIRQGHILARKIDVFQRIKGEHGLLKIPGGFIDLLYLFFDSYKFARNGDKTMYQ